MTIVSTAPSIDKRILGNFSGFPRSADTDKKSWIVMTVHAGVQTESATTLTSTVPRAEHLSFSNPMYLSDSLSAACLNCDPEDLLPDVAQHFANRLALATSTIPGRNSREDGSAEMISSSQIVRTVAAAVFNNMRSLTEKERRYLGKFYDRAYKTR